MVDAVDEGLRETERFVLEHPSIGVRERPNVPGHRRHDGFLGILALLPVKVLDSECEWEGSGCNGRGLYKLPAISCVLRRAGEVKPDVIDVPRVVE
jgi:hypothetical protein